jgi:iron complex transport system permease protein
MRASDTPSQGAAVREGWQWFLQDAREGEWYSRPVAAMALLAGSVVALIFCIMLSISVGAADVPLAEAWHAVFSYNPSNTNHIIIHEVRLPRVVAGAMVGVAFAVAGAIMQGMTRNPLASPSLMGLNSGAYFMITLGLVFLPWLTLNDLIWLSFVGAAMGAGIVYGIGSMAQGGLTPVKLALAGIAVSALLSALSEGLAILRSEAFQLLLFFAGGVAGTSWEQVQILLPFLVIGLLGGMVLARNITVLSLGEDVARGLGQRTVLVKAAGSVAVVALAGSAVWVGGPIGFIGLIIPHVARFLVGLDYRWIIPASAMLGALMLVLADLGARMVNPPFETPVGIVTAAVGVPFFLYLARRDQRGM